MHCFHVCQSVVKSVSVMCVLTGMMDDFELNYEVVIV